jgi:hypothetical protein
MDVVSFSDLQLRGKSTVESWLRKSTPRALLVRRRDAEDLVLTTASRATQAREVSSVTARLLAALIDSGPGVREQVTHVMPEVYPWTAFLSHDEVAEFATELVSTMRAADSIDNPAPVAHVIEAWRHTAEALADPDVAAVLGGPSSDDFGTVQPPRKVPSK